MKNKTLVKTLAVALGLGMLCAFAPQEALAWGRERVIVLPDRHEVIAVRGGSYHYYDGRFYRPDTRGFVVVRPPMGVVVRGIPPGHRRFMYRGTRYYCYDNIYYRDCPRGYIVVPRPSIFSIFIDLD